MLVVDETWSGRSLAIVERSAKALRPRECVVRLGVLALVHHVLALRVGREACSAHSDPALLDSGERDLPYEVPDECRRPAVCERAREGDDGVDG